MSPITLEKEILFYLQNLPKEALQEAIDFIRFLSYKNKIRPKEKLSKKLLTSLNETSSSHLEEEIFNYKEIFPREK